MYMLGAHIISLYAGMSYIDFAAERYDIIVYQEH